MLKLSYFLLNLLVVIVYNICLICCKEILHKNSCNVVMLNCYFFRARISAIFVEIGKTKLLKLLVIIVDNIFQFVVK
jgi:hypothetical protein